MSSLQKLSEQLTRPEGIRRLGQALWMMVGRPIRLGELLWARGLLGDGGDNLLWETLLEVGAVSHAESELEPVPVARLLCALWEPCEKRDSQARLVWTLPHQLGMTERENSYVQAAQELIDSASRKLLVVSPFLEPKGIGHLHKSLLAALHRGVEVSLITHGAETLSSLASSAVEELRRDSVGLAGELSVFSVKGSCGLLVHSKLVIADTAKMVVGSANVTGKGLTENFEAGAVLGREAALEACATVDALLTSGLVDRVF